MNPLEIAQGSNRPAGNIRKFQIELRNLISRPGTGIRHSNFEGS
jgi:hypothetical protein